MFYSNLLKVVDIKQEVDDLYHPEIIETGDATPLKIIIFTSKLREWSSDSIGGCCELKRSDPRYQRREYLKRPGRLIARLFTALIMAEG